jgi:O-antigen ligase
MFRFNITNLLLTLGIACFPVYIFPSGSLQISHLLFLVLFIFFLIKYKFEIIDWTNPLLLLFIYSLFVEAVYAIIAGEVNYLIDPAYLIFNILISIAIYNTILKFGTISLRIGILIATAIAISLVYASGVALTVDSEASRGVGGFNNPNQMGYFSTCLFSIACLLFINKKMTLLEFCVLLLSAAFLSIASLSKAAILGNIIVLPFAFYALYKRSKIALKIITIMLLVIGGIYAFKLEQVGAFENIQFYNRILNIQTENDSSAESRGYFAFLEANDLQIFTGMGGQNAFKIVGHEVHSTVGAVFNLYGVVGLLFFLWFYYIWIAKIKHTMGLHGVILILGPPFLYGLTHNGIRFSIFWATVSASLAVAKYVEYERKSGNRKY